MKKITSKQKIELLVASYFLVGGAVYLASRSQAKADTTIVQRATGTTETLPSPGPFTIFWWLPKIFS